MAKAKINWSMARQEYVNSPEGLTKQSLADKYGVRIETVVRRATKEHWDFDRASFLRITSEKTTEKRSDAVSSFAADWNGICADAAKRLMDKALAEMDNGGRVRDVAAALKIAQDMGKAASGESPADAVLTILATLQERYK